MHQDSAPAAKASPAFHVQGSTHAQSQHLGVDLRLMVPNRPASEIDIHRHDDAHLILVVRGNYQTSASAVQKLETQAPLLVLNPPRTEHRDCFAPEQTLQHAQFFSMTLSASTWLDLSNAMPLPAQASAAAGPAALALSTNWAQRFTLVPHDPMALQDALVDALSVFSAGLCKAGSRSAAWVSIAQRLMRDAVYGEAGMPRLAALAGSLGVHPVYMARAFRKHMGVSPAQYLRALQMDKAVALLRSTQRSLVDIALDCHFFDQAHLSHAVRAAYGRAPSALRAQVR